MASKRLIFITGVEGTGTTLALRLLSSAPTSAAIGGNHFDLPDDPRAAALASAFAAATKTLWDRERAPGTDDAARMRVRRDFDTMVGSPAFADIDTFVFKRSAPFGRPRDRYLPNPADMLDLSPATRIIVMYRDPRAAAYSSIRRFGGPLVQVAHSVAANLTRLSRLIEALPDGVAKVVFYGALCADPDILAQVGAFCGVSVDACEPLNTAGDNLYRAALASDELQWLDEFFRGDRAVEWRALAG